MKVCEDGEEEEGGGFSEERDSTEVKSDDDDEIDGDISVDFFKSLLGIPKF
jgi:hypothetical protein